METRMKFKLASQFSNLWKDIIALNMIKKTRDGVMSRATATKVAIGAMSGNSGAESAVISLGNFCNDFNAKNNQPVAADLELTFNVSNQKITAPAGNVITYKVVAFDEQNTPIGTHVTTYTSDGTAKNIDLPAIFGTAVRYDIMVFTSNPTDGNEEYTGRISDILGEDQAGSSADNVYSLYAQMVAESLIEITGILSDSYTVE